MNLIPKKNEGSIPTKTEPSFPTDETSVRTPTERLVYSLTFFCIFTFSLTVHTFDHFPMETHFRPLHKKDLLAGKDFIELAQIGSI